MPISISGNIPQGRINVIDASDPSNIRLSLPKDPGTPFFSWYNFRVSGARDVPLTFVFEDIGASVANRMDNRDDVEDAWTNTGPLVSEDGETWVRAPAVSDGETWTFSYTPKSDLATFAEFPPFGPERDQALVYRALRDSDVRLEVIGQSYLGRPIDLLTFGTPGPDKPHLWISTRQHPSETQGGFFLEGVFDRLLDPYDAAARVLREQAVLYIVPNANPDGNALGLSRANAAGSNLNREWHKPDTERAPEVVAIRAQMMERGLDLFIDGHSDSELRCNFIWPSENVPGWTPHRWKPFRVFETALDIASPDYETGHPYPGGAAPKEPDLGMAWNWVGAAFPRSLSILLEQATKDTTLHPMAGQGWLPQRARGLGRDMVPAMLAVLPHLSRQGQAVDV